MQIRHSHADLHTHYLAKRRRIEGQPGYTVVFCVNKQTNKLINKQNKDNRATPKALLLLGLPSSLPECVSQAHGEAVEKDGEFRGPGKGKETLLQSSFKSLQRRCCLPKDTARRAFVTPSSAHLHTAGCLCP